MSFPWLSPGFLRKNHGSESAGVEQQVLQNEGIEALYSLETQRRALGSPQFIGCPYSIDYQRVTRGHQRGYSRYSSYFLYPLKKIIVKYLFIISPIAIFRYIMVYHLKQRDMHSYCDSPICGR